MTYDRAMLATLLLFTLLTVVRGHFQMQFPVPRGPFVEPNEVNFCGEYIQAFKCFVLKWTRSVDSYTEAVSNRSLFPLDNGFITLNSEHPQWTGNTPNLRVF